MFYECQKCKRRWSHPLSECPYCLIVLDKMPESGAKVRGAAKVSIPTLFHPNTPYNVLVLEDGGGNCWSHKSEKEYQIGEEFAIEGNNNPDAVAVWRVKYDQKEAIAKALDLIGGIDVGANAKIAVLPTLEKASHSYFRDNTSPEFLAAVLGLLLEKGAKAENIAVAGQSFGDVPVGAMAQKSGLVAVCQKFGIVPTDLAAGEFIQSGQFEISKTILEADIFINLSMEKMGRAAACENMFRVLKKESYEAQAYLSSKTAIAAGLAPLLKNMIVIGEAEFVPRSNRLAAFLGLALASRSAANLDRAFGEIAQSFKMPEIIKDIPMETIPLAGRTIKEVQYQAEIF